MNSEGVYLSRIFFDFFLKPVYPTMFSEKSQIYGVKINGKYICESKNWICSFLHTHPNKTPPSSYHYTSRQKEITKPSLTAFSENLFFPSRKRGEYYRVEKMTEIKRAKVLVTSFCKFHHLYNLYIFGFSFIVS